MYFWVDGLDFEARLEEAKQCLLVIMGADVTGKQERVGLWDGYRESEQSWKELLLDLKQRGLAQGPSLAIGDGALGQPFQHVYLCARSLAVETCLPFSYGVRSGGFFLRPRGCF